MHIFISYAKADSKALAKDLHRQLNGMEGITAWMDESLEAAQSWAEQLENEIKRADYLLVLISPDVNREETPKQARSFVLREISFAQSLNKPILTALVATTSIPIVLQGDQHIDLRDKQLEMGKAKILDFFAKKAGSTGQNPSQEKAQSPRKFNFRWPRLSEAIVIALIGAAATIIAAFITSQGNNNPSTNNSPSPSASNNISLSSTTPQATLAFMGTEGLFEIDLLYDGETAFSILALSESDLRSVQLLAGTNTITLLDYFPEVLSQPLAAGDCLRFVQSSAEAPPLPRACSQPYSLNLSDTEIFWFDKLQNQAINIRLLFDDSSLGLCSAAMGTCRFNQDGMQ